VSANARGVLMAMATFASHPGAFVSAEGIEDEDMLDFIRGIDDGELRRKAIIQGGQGYGLGRPSAELACARSPLVLEVGLVSFG
jgi:EAL domain-containing protein (putative c-di-GMP-specific phosphodiesterase class I)